MAQLIYSVNMSLDGFIEDTSGSFGWSEPDDEVFKFITDRERLAGTHLYGRKMYETLLVWETDPNLVNASPLYRGYADMWQAPDKIVYSRTLQSAPTRKTRIERDFRPEAVKQLKDSASADLIISGPNIAAQAFRASLVDECQLYLRPIALGGGKPALPADLRLELDLLEEQRFREGSLFLRYRVRH